LSVANAIDIPIARNVTPFMGYRTIQRPDAQRTPINVVCVCVRGIVVFFAYDKRRKQKLRRSHMSH